MDPVCASVNGSFLEESCLSEEARGILDPTTLDVGFEETRLNSDGDSVAKLIRGTYGIDDGFVSLPEIAQRILDSLTSGAPVYPSLRKRVIIPWIADDLDPGTVDDGKLTNWVTSEIQSIQSELVKEGLTAGEFSYAVSFYERFFAALTRPSSDGGFELTFDSSFATPARTLAEIYVDRKANCVEFSGLILMASELAGVPVEILEVWQGQSGAIQQHVRIGLRNPSSGNIEKIIDLQADSGRNGYFGDPVSGELWTRISKRELLSYYYNMKGVRESDATLAEASIDIALQLNPHHYLILFNKSYYCYLRGDLRQAKAYLLESIQINPAYSKAFRNLGIVADALGDDVTSKWADERLKVLTARRK